jgi:hypothetical protein
MVSFWRGLVVLKAYKDWGRRADGTDTKCKGAAMRSEMAGTESMATGKGSWVVERLVAYGTTKE